MRRYRNKTSTSYGIWPFHGDCGNSVGARVSPGALEIDALHALTTVWSVRACTRIDGAFASERI